MRCEHGTNLALHCCAQCLRASLAAFVGDEVIAARGYGCPNYQAPDWKTYNCGKCRDCRARTVLAGERTPDPGTALSSPAPAPSGEPLQTSRGVPALRDERAPHESRLHPPAGGLEEAGTIPPSPMLECKSCLYMSPTVDATGVCGPCRSAPPPPHPSPVTQKPACDCGQSGPLHLPTCALIRWERSGSCERERAARAKAEPQPPPGELDVEAIRKRCDAATTGTGYKGDLLQRLGVLGQIVRGDIPLLLAEIARLRAAVPRTLPARTVPPVEIETDDDAPPPEELTSLLDDLLGYEWSDVGMEGHPQCPFCGGYDPASIKDGDRAYYGNRADHHSDCPFPRIRALSERGRR